MKTLEEIAELINNAKYDSLWQTDEYLEYDLKIEACKQGLDVDKHRWYETSINVYPIGDRFLGVRGLSQCYSEMSDPSNCMEYSQAFEMDEIKTVTYIERKVK